MAGLLLGTANVLVLDEPGNHLDVETVEALAEAMDLYKGTVVFTSHDRHFVSRVATRVIEVRDGTAKVYFGDYESYLASVEKEIDDDEQARNKASGKMSPPPPAKAKGEVHRDQGKDSRKSDKELKNLEKKIAKLDDDKKDLTAKMLKETNPNEAMKQHEAIEAINAELAECEERWLELSDFS
jgi:ATP-binding cassette subfamily F protein 3